MASPQRRDPNPPPELVNLEKGGVERKVSPGWRMGFWWIWILIIAGIWYVGYGWGNHGGWFRAGRRAAAVEPRNDTQMTGDGVPILNATNKAQYVGQVFQIQNAPVEAKVSNEAFWIGNVNNSTPMLMVLVGPARNAENAAMRPGDWVDANGRVMTAPDATQAKQQWGLTDQDVQRLEKEGAYIQANQAQRTQH